MPPSQRRRMSRPQPAVGAATEAPADDPVEQVEDIDVVDPVDHASAEGGEAEPAPESSSRSSRRGARGSSRDSARASNKRSAASDKKKTRVTARRQLSPEELAARRASRMAVLGIFCGTILTIGLGVGAWYLFIFKSEKVKKAEAFLAVADQKIKDVENGIGNFLPAQARKAQKEGKEALQQPELVFANEPVNLDDKNSAGPEYQIRAINMFKLLNGELQKRIEKVERDQKVESNHQHLLAGFAVLSTCADAALTQTEKEVANFLLNPVEPEAGPNPGYVDEYPNVVADIKVRLDVLRKEKDRRLKAITDVPVLDAYLDAQALVMQEQFQDALTKVEESQKKFTTADMAPVVTYIKGAAKEAWDAALAYSEHNYKDATADGVDQAMRETAQANAVRRMQTVIDRFGLPEYTSQAKAKIESYQPREAR